MAIQRYSNPLASWFGSFPSFSDLDDLFPTLGRVAEPPIKLYETDKEVVVEAPVYGVDPKEVKVSIEGSTLRIVGSAKKEEKEEKGKRVYYSNMQTSFNYEVQLPTQVEGSKAKAEVKNGVISVKVPKTSQAKGTTIKVVAK